MGVTFASCDDQRDTHRIKQRRVVDETSRETCFKGNGAVSSAEREESEGQ